MELTEADFISVQTKMRHRGRRWLHRHGHLNGEQLVYSLQKPTLDG